MRIVDEEGEGVLHLAVTGSAHASMSDEWREAAVAHRGMPADGWVGTERVEVTTLDSLIGEFGAPASARSTSRVSSRTYLPG